MIASAAQAPSPGPGRRIGVIAPVSPITAGAAQFNDAMVAALRDRGPVEVLSWRRLYPPLLYRGEERSEAAGALDDVDFLLAWHAPRSWRTALRRLEAFGAEALVVPWLHPVLAPPYRWLLRHVPRGVRRVVVCHNVHPHEPFRGARRLTRETLRHADLLVTHAPQQRAELEELGLGHVGVVELFHPRFVARDLAAAPSAAAIAAERLRLGSPSLLLLCFGAVRPYKGVDVALRALAAVSPKLRVRLVVAGRFWEDVDRYHALADELGLGDRVELRDRYVPNDEAALLFSAADAVVLPYRSASQSGVAQLAFAYGRPVIATRVGGLPAAVRDGRDGILCAPEDPVALARAIERLAAERDRFAQAVERANDSCSFARYVDLLERALER